MPNVPSVPKLDFVTFILSISSAALMGLGLTPKPGSQKLEVNLELAKQNIDLLELIKEKTKNNLTKEEEKLLDNILYETRMKFIEVKGKS